MQAAPEQVREGREGAQRKMQLQSPHNPQANNPPEEIILSKNKRANCRDCPIVLQRLMRYITSTWAGRRQALPQSEGDQAAAKVHPQQYKEHATHQCIKRVPNQDPGQAAAKLMSMGGGIRPPPKLTCPKDPRNKQAPDTPASSHKGP